MGCERDRRSFKYAIRGLHVVTIPCRGRLLLTRQTHAGFDNSTSLAWGLLWNWQVPNFGEGLTLSGCQQEIQDGDEVLYAYAIYDGDGREAGVYLKVSPATVTAKVGGSVTFTVIDGVSGKPAPNATIHGAPANAEGKITVNYPTAGYFPFKAKQEGAVRSNLVKVTVTK